MRVNLVVGLYYGGSGFTTQSSFETGGGDGAKTCYTFCVDRDSIPDLPSSS